MIGLPFDVPEVGQRLGMGGIESEFTLEFLACFFIPLRLPEEVAEAEMNVGLSRAKSWQRPEIPAMASGFSQTVQRFPDRTWSGGGIRILFEDPAKCLARRQIYFAHRQLWASIW